MYKTFPGNLLPEKKRNEKYKQLEITIVPRATESYQLRPLFEKVTLVIDGLQISTFGCINCNNSQKWYFNIPFIALSINLQTLLQGPVVLTLLNAD